MAIGVLNKNSWKLGIVLGLMMPLLGLVIYYYWRIAPNSWSAFFHYLKIEKRLLSSLTVVCLLMNVGVFTYYVNNRKDNTAKGIFAITVLYAIVSLLVKFLG